METSKLDIIKYQLYDAYVAKRRQKMPSYKGGDDLVTAVKKAAAHCMRLNADPKDWINALYEVYGTLYDKFYPTCLAGPKAEEIYNKYVQQRFHVDNEPAEHWQVQLAALKRMLDTGRHLKDILLDRSATSLSPWFRIIITKEPDRDVIARFAMEAQPLLTKRLRSFLEAQHADIERIVNYEQYL